MKLEAEDSAIYTWNILNKKDNNNLTCVEQGSEQSFIYINFTGMHD